MMNFLRKKNKGFSLVEVIVVTAIVTTAFMGVIVLIKRSIKIRYMNQNYLIASQLANEGLELSRDIRNENWLRGEKFNLNLVNETENNDEYYVVDYNVRPGFVGTIVSESSGRKSLWDEEGGIDYKDSFGTSLSVTNTKSDSTKLNLITDTDGNRFYSHKDDSFSNITSSEPTIFHRIMHATYNTDGGVGSEVNYLTIEARIYWQERGNDKYYIISTNLYDYDWYY